MKQMHFHGLKRRLLQASLVGVVGTAAALAGAPALAQQSPHGHGAMMHAHGGPGGANFDPERARTRMQERLRRMLSSVGASEAQITQIQGIWSTAMTDLASIRKERQTARQAMNELLTRPAIDRRALEDARKQQLALADRSSQRFTQALADAAEVLDPQQRAKLAEMMKNRRGRGPGMGSGPGGFMS